ncbi:MAG: sel1 repeat family protein [Clostridia bacterium]|nr:sel1 repeat family protein [Clostridia bacterium]
MREEIRALLSGEPKTDTAAVTAAFLSATDPARKRELLGLLDKISEYEELTAAGVFPNGVTYTAFVTGNCPYELPRGQTLALMKEIMAGAKDGDPLSLYRAAVLILDEMLGLPDTARAVAYLKAAAEKGIAEAYYELGVCAINGEGLPRDAQTAKTYYEKAAAGGSVSAMLALAALYRGGKGFAEDGDRMYFWYKKAAEAGAPEGYLNLAICTFNGSGTEASVEKAIALAQKAQDLGNGDAKLLLRRLQRYYEEGDIDANELAARNRKKVSD